MVNGSGSSGCMGRPVVAIIIILHLERTFRGWDNTYLQYIGKLLKLIVITYFYHLFTNNDLNSVQT